MKKIVLASSNQHKCQEIAEILEGYEIISVKAFTDHFDVIENGLTYEENALIKARAAYKITGLPTIADDSGLNVEAMQQAPGIYSARFLGKKTSYTLKNQVIIDVCGENQNFNASFTCVIAYIDANGREFLFRYDLEGRITEKLLGNHGFGYDPIFIPKNCNQTMAELTTSEKNQLSHRYNALQKLKKHLTQQPKLNVVLYQPEIPQNTGNIMRTCVATNTVLHLIKPLGFEIDEKRIRRSGMDYIQHLEYYIYENWEDFVLKNPSKNYYFLTRYGKKAPSEFAFPQEDVYFVLGSESKGINKAILQQHLEQCMRLPMNENARSLNLSNCAAIILYEALRQFDYHGLSKTEMLKGENFLNE